MNSEEKKLRREKIIELIRDYDIKTQSELSDKLIECGFNITQATVSRDIQKLNLIKKRRGTELVYTILDDVDISNNDMLNVIKASITRLDVAINILVIHTKPGMANACCLAIDNLKFKEVLGSVAGEDTIILVSRNEDETLLLYNKIKIYIGWKD